MANSFDSGMQQLRFFTSWVASPLQTSITWKASELLLSLASPFWTLQHRRPCRLCYCRHSYQDHPNHANPLPMTRWATKQGWH